MSLFYTVTSNHFTSFPMLILVPFQIFNTKINSLSYQSFLGLVSSGVIILTLSVKTLKNQ